MKLLFATGNAGKLREAREILGRGYEIVSPGQLGLNEEPEETGLTFQENSLLKAEFYRDRLGLDCFSDDSGLEVDALGGAPGIYSARYAGGSGHDFDANIEKLLSELDKLGPDVPRSARFRCVVTLLLDGKPYFFEGKLEGKIAFGRRGNGGFGYDPVFLPDVFPEKTLAEVGESAKNIVSHRGMALRSMAAWLESKGK